MFGGIYLYFCSIAYEFAMATAGTIVFDGNYDKKTA